jgi:hypothetical protein
VAHPCTETYENPEPQLPIRENLLLSKNDMIVIKKNYCLSIKAERYAKNPNLIFFVKSKLFRIK